MQELRVNRDRLWRTIEETGAIGATKNGGLCRLTLSDEDRRVRDWLVAQCKAEGCEIGIDSLGTIFAVRKGSDAAGLPIAFGSHLDTQPTGGRFDGVLGVLAGLEIMRALNEANVDTRASLCLVDWTNEEGSRFAPAMLASGVYASRFELEWALARRDVNNVSFGDALEAIGYSGSEPVGARRFAAFLELHIEQGPLLEHGSKTIGVVEGAQGLIWYDAEIVGMENHAGTTPMDLRRDALTAFSEICLGVEAIARDHSGVGTVGYVKVEPGSRNTIPGRVRFSIEFRHPSEAGLEHMDKALLQTAGELRSERGVQMTIEEIWRNSPVQFGPGCIAAVEAAAVRLGYPHCRMSSGAGHDACNVSLVAPTAMIFIPCQDGVSHRESEFATPEMCEAGANVLLESVLSLANR